MVPASLRPRRALLAVGLLVVAVGYVTGGWTLLHGYGKAGPAYLVHAGVLCVLLWTATTGLARTGLGPAPPRRELLAAVLALAALYPLAVAGIWYDLVATPPPRYGGTPTLAGFLVDRASFVLLLSPLPFGYAVGVARAAPDRTVDAAAVGGTVGSVVAAAALARAQGAAPGFAELFYAGMGLVGVVAALPLFLLGRAQAVESSRRPASPPAD